MLIVKHINVIKSSFKSIWKKYELLELSETSESNVFRGIVKKPNGSIKPDAHIIIRETNKGKLIADLYNYAEGEDFKRIFLSSGKTVSKDTIINQPNEEEKEKKRKEKLIKFNRNLPEIDKLAEPSSIFKIKNIKQYGNGYRIKPKIYRTGYDKTLIEVYKPFLVPFYASMVDAEKNKPCAGQIIGVDRTGKKSRKTNIPSSIMSEGFHVLQKGKPDAIFGVIDCFLSESYTTACEIAEAMPDYMVVCCAGQNNILKIYNKLQTYDYNIIIVLDKVIQGKNTSSVERIIKSNRYSFIQPNPMDSRLVNITDFNDVQHLLGKKAAKKEIALQAYKFLTVPPECLYYDSDKGFKILNPQTQCVETLPKTKLLRYFTQMCSDLTANKIIETNCLPLSQEYNINEATLRKLKDLLLNEVSRVRSTQPRGTGLFKDGEGFVLNLFGNERYTLQKDKKWFLDFNSQVRPFSDNRYVNSTMFTVALGKDLPDLINSDFNKEDLKKLISLWNKTFDLPTSTFLFILGFLVQASFTSFSPTRPHIWLRGPMGSGKSYIINHIMANLLRHLAVSTQASSKAGVEQVISEEDVFHTPLVLSDEGALDTIEKKKKATELIAMSREVFMGGLIPTFKGTKDQIARIYYRAFSIVMASVTDGLSDEQDISRFIFIDVKDFKLVGDEYLKISDEFKRIGDKLLLGIIHAAPYFLDFCQLINKDFESYYDIDRKTIGHKQAGLSTSLAGLAALRKVLYPKESNKKIVKKVLKGCEPFVLDQIRGYIERIQVEPDFIDILKRTYFRIGEAKGRLTDLCEEGESSEMHDSFGLRFRKGRKDDVGYYNLLVDKSKYRLNALLENPKQIEGNIILDSLSKLVELKLRKKIKEASIGGKRYFLIPRFKRITDDE